MLVEGTIWRRPCQMRNAEGETWDHQNKESPKMRQGNTKMNINRCYPAILGLSFGCSQHTCLHEDCFTFTTSCFQHLLTQRERHKHTLENMFWTLLRRDWSNFGCWDQSLIFLEDLTSEDSVPALTGHDSRGVFSSMDPMDPFESWSSVPNIYPVKFHEINETKHIIMVVIPLLFYDIHVKSH